MNRAKIEKELKDIDYMMNKMDIRRQCLLNLLSYKEPTKMENIISGTEAAYVRSNTSDTPKTQPVASKQP